MHQDKFLLSPYSAPQARADFLLSPEEVAICDLIVSHARTFFEMNG
jgi:hypothetical protein